MKVVILAGGHGTRIAEETHLRPKPMIEIGGRPILWHIMKGYAHFGVTDFVVCLGYRGYMIKEYFTNYVLHRSDITIDLAENAVTYHQTPAEPWRVTLVDTGAETMTGGRLARAAPYLGNDERFFMTYGDGVANLDVAALLDFHHGHGLEATVTVVRPPGRFGATLLAGDRVTRFAEKPAGGEEGFINGGFFVLERRALDRVDAGDETVWERGPLEGLARDGQLAGYRHEGFWQPMDTLRERTQLENLWAEGRAPWRIWD